jgi:hypothetical protein
MNAIAGSLYRDGSKPRTSLRDPTRISHLRECRLIRV